MVNQSFRSEESYRSTPLNFRTSHHLKFAIFSTEINDFSTFYTFILSLFASVPLLLFLSWISQSNYMVGFYVDLSLITYDFNENQINEFKQIKTEKEHYML